MTDRAWPGLYGGTGKASPYSEDELNRVAERIKEAFQQKKGLRSNSPLRKGD